MRQRREAVGRVWSAGRAAVEALPGLRWGWFDHELPDPGDEGREEREGQLTRLEEQARKYHGLAALRETAERAAAGEGGVYRVDWSALDALLELSPEEEGSGSGRSAGPAAFLALFDDLDAGPGGAGVPDGEEPDFLVLEDFLVPEDMEVEDGTLGQDPGFPIDPEQLAEERALWHLLAATDADEENPASGDGYEGE